MKLRIFATLIAIVVGNSAFAQVCNPNYNITTPGLPEFNDTTPCIEQGQFYHADISFRNFSTFMLSGNVIAIDSIRIDTISNLPCGINWATSKTSQTYYANELGCVFLTGTTSDAVGQYKIYMAITVYVGGTAIRYNAEGLGAHSYLKIKASSGASCPSIDTSGATTNLTASCITPQPTPSNSCGLVVTIMGAHSICAGDSTTLTTTVFGSSNGGNISYQWATGSTASSITVSSSAFYDLTVTDGSCTAQNAFNVVVSNCNTACNSSSNITSPSLPIFNDSTPCVVQGQAYSTVISFLNYSSFVLNGTTVAIDSIRIDTISNLPCGLTWSANKPSITYSPAEIGCITVSGTTNDSVGQYLLNMSFTAFVGGTPILYNASGLGLISILRLSASGTACPAVDTAATGFLTATCVSSPPINQIGSVIWPGDANSDGVVDANDALQIAIEYGSTGPVRPNASLAWVAQPAADWTGITNTVNDKHADSDGDGIISTNDTLAVAQNYSLTHLKTEGQRAQASDPVISLVPVTDTLQANQSFHIKVMLGDAATPVDSLYGIAFSMNLDPAIFDTTGAQFVMNTSWIGNGSNSFCFRKAVPSQGKIDMVLARTNHQNASGYGQIGELILHTQARVATSTTTLTLTPTVIKGLTASNAPKTYNTQTSTVSVTGIEEPTLAQYIGLYPNPSNGHFILTISQASKTLNVELLNIQGQVLYTEQLKDVTTLQKEFSLNDLAKGVYLLKVSTENGVAVKRVVIGQ